MNNALQLFEADRRMELKLRLAAKKAAEVEADKSPPPRFAGQILEEVFEIPEHELLRLIERVHKL